MAAPLAKTAKAAHTPGNPAHQQLSLRRSAPSDLCDLQPGTIVLALASNCLSIFVGVLYVKWTGPPRSAKVKASP